MRRTSSRPQSSCARHHAGRSPDTSIVGKKLSLVMRSLGRRMARVVFAVCGLPMLLSACAAAPVAPEPAASIAAPPDTRSVHVVNHGSHSGLVLRDDDVPAAEWSAKADFADAVYFDVGWGDRRSYQAMDPGLWLALKAAFWPRPGVLPRPATSGSRRRCAPPGCPSGPHRR